MAEPISYAVGSARIRMSDPWHSDADYTPFGVSLVPAAYAGWWGSCGLAVERNDAPLAVTVLASADAVGRDTVATTDVQVRLYSRGLVSFSFGTVTCMATAFAAAGGIAYATVQNQVSVGGADLLFASTSTRTGSGESGGLAWASETSTTRFFAFDVLGYRPWFGSLTVGLTSEGTLSAPLGTVEGNLAAFDVDVRAIGDNTAVEVNADALTVEDSLSTTTVSALAALGAPDANAAGASDVFRVGTAWGDRITTGKGDDWVFGGGGRDVINVGAGDNAAFGNAGDDQIVAGSGDDWAFGGDGCDTLVLGDGNNIGYGGSGNDRITAGSGNDALCGGAGNDIVDGGNGQNSFLLGSGNAWGDGNDCYYGGSGSDWYFLAGPFGCDTVSGFTVRQGDKLVAYEGAWSTDQDLRARNGSSVWLQRSSSDSNDLVVTLRTDAGMSALTLDNFFKLNTAYGAAPRKGVFTDDQALPILRDIFVGGSGNAVAEVRAEAFLIGENLSNLA